MQDDPDNNKLALIINTLYSAGYDEDQIRETLMKSETELLFPILPECSLGFRFWFSGVQSVGLGFSMAKSAVVC